MTNEPDENLEERLRTHYGRLPPVPPDLAVSIALPDRARRPSLRIRFLAAAAAAVVIVTAAITVGRAPLALDNVTAPSAAPLAQPRGTAAASEWAGQPLTAGEIRRLTEDFAPGLAGQLVYVAEERTLPDGTEQVVIQHWGNLEHGLTPDTTFATVSSDGLAAASTPYQPTCPDRVASILDVAQLQPFERLVCFGDRELTFGPVIASEYHVSRLTRWLSADGSPDFLTALPLPVASAGQRLPDGVWVEVTGRFDEDWPNCFAPDPTWCREQFVVSSYREVDPPDFVYRGAWRQTIAPTGGRRGHGMTWTGSEAFVWGGAESDAQHTVFEPNLVRYGLAYGVENDAWRRTSPAPIEGRLNPSVEWSGSEVLVWGGQRPDGAARHDGAAYNPMTDDWRRLPTAPLQASAVSFARMINGRLVAVTDAGSAAYDPATDRWTEAPSPPIELHSPTWAVARDRLVVVEPGDGSTPVRAAVFDPGTLAWTEMDRNVIPLAPLEAGILAVDGADAVYFLEAGRAIDPLSGAWRKVTACPRVADDGVWTGTRVLGIAATYDPATDRCLQLPQAPHRAPPFQDSSGRESTAGIWTGSEYLTWSGGTGGDIVFDPNDGAIFLPDRP